MAKPVSPEVVDELEHEVTTALDPVREAELSVQAAKRQAELLRGATVAQTLPSDWVKQGDYGYLQDCGCQRVAPLWGIQFSPTKLSDFEKEILPEGHVRFSVMVSGRSERVPGLERTEIGTRSTASEFWKKRWENPEISHGEREQILMDVKKAALTNAHGRVTRALSGMGRMPIEQLGAYGLDVGKIPGVEYQSSAKGGSGNNASEPQMKRIAALACFEGKVEGVERKDFNKTLQTLKENCLLSKKAASELMEFIEKSEEPVSKAEFWKRAGYKKSEAAAPKDDEGGAE